MPKGRESLLSFQQHLHDGKCSRVSENVGINLKEFSQPRDGRQWDIPLQDSICMEDTLQSPPV